MPVLLCHCALHALLVKSYCTGALAVPAAISVEGIRLAVAEAALSPVAVVAGVPVTVLKAGATTPHLHPDPVGGRVAYAEALSIGALQQPVALVVGRRIGSHQVHRNIHGLGRSHIDG